MGSMRMKLFVMTASVAALVGAAAGPAFAHHAFSTEFDASKPIKLKGTVTRMDWINPHSWIYVDVKKDDGTVEKWMIEGGAPNAMFRRGFKKDSLPVGTEIVIDGFLARDGSNKANGRELTFTDGRRLFVGSSGTGAPEDGKDPGGK
jgi:hypothetical protein